MTGGLVGLPGQSVESLADDVMLAGELNAEMFSFGPVLASHRRHEQASTALLAQFSFNKITFDILMNHAREQGLVG